MIWFSERGVQPLAAQRSDPDGPPDRRCDEPLRPGAIGSSWPVIGVGVHGIASVDEYRLPITPADRNLLVARMTRTSCSVPNSVPKRGSVKDLSAAPTLLAVRANDVHVDVDPCGSRIWAGHADPYPRYTPDCTTSSIRSTRSSRATAPPAGPFSTSHLCDLAPRSSCLSSNAAYLSSVLKADRGDFGP